TLTLTFWTEGSSSCLIVTETAADKPTTMMLVKNLFQLGPQCDGDDRLKKTTNAGLTMRVHASWKHWLIPCLKLRAGNDMHSRSHRNITESSGGFMHLTDCILVALRLFVR
ncbi:unnamed protein product, partial [Ectocarpus sp. 13 AM-2016]